MNTEAQHIKTDATQVTRNDQALSRYKAIQAIMRTMRLGGLTTWEANQAADIVAMVEVGPNTPFFIRGSFDQTMNTLSKYATGIKQSWQVGTHADSGLSYAWRTGTIEPNETDGLTNDPNPDFPGEEMEIFTNTVTVTVKK